MGSCDIYIYRFAPKLIVKLHRVLKEENSNILFKSWATNEHTKRLMGDVVKKGVRNRDALMKGAKK